MPTLAGTVDGDTVFFDLSSQDAFANLKASTTTYRLVGTTPQLTPNTRESAQLILSDLLVGTISFSTDEPGSDAIAQLSLPENTIE